MRKGYSLFQVIIIIVITSIVSAIAVGTILTKGFTNIGYSQISDDKNIQNFLSVYNKIVSEYYEDVDKAKIVESAINGMMNYLDESYTTYLDKSEANSLVNQLNATYEGIGITIKDKEIVDVFDNSPAMRKGIQKNDVIISVNGVVTTELSSLEISKLIKENSQNVVLELKRNNELITVNLATEIINKPSTNYKMIDNTKIGYIKMDVFSNKLSEEVRSNLSKLNESGMNSLIIDLRGNTGGYLEQASEVASMFLKKGKVIYSLERKNGKQEFKDTTEESKDYPIVVLVNSLTASAAEILTGALKDSYGATVVGVKTYGKGKVQQTYSLDTGGLVKYTSSRWLRPNGECIDEDGIYPDYILKNDYIYDETDPENPILKEIVDNQLNKAIELIS